LRAGTVRLKRSAKDGGKESKSERENPSKRGREELKRNSHRVSGGPGAMKKGRLGGRYEERRRKKKRRRKEGESTLLCPRCSGAIESDDLGGEGRKISRPD